MEGVRFTSIVYSAFVLATFVTFLGGKVHCSTSSFTGAAACSHTHTQTDEERGESNKRSSVSSLLGKR